MIFSRMLAYSQDFITLGIKSVDNPKEPIDPVATKRVMDTIIAANIFAGSNLNVVSVKEVRLVEHNVTGYELV